MVHALIFMSDTGGGHRSLSNAIAAAVEGLGPGRARATIVDLFAEEGVGPAGAAMRLYGPLIRIAPSLYGVIFHLSDSAGQYGFARRWLGRPIARAAARIISRVKPDIVVFAHALAVVPGLDGIALLRRTGSAEIPSVAMVTELATVHQSWLDERVTRYFAANGDIVRALEQRGATPGNIVVTGLPVGPNFGRLNEPPASARERLRLVAGQTTALILAGGEGSGPVEQIVPWIVRAVPELQLVVVCGRNSALRERLGSQGFPPNVQILGFANNVSELMHAADFVLTKGGPQSIAETLAAGRPAVITELLPGQESGNGAYVVRHGAGILALTPPDVLAATRRLTSDLAFRDSLARSASNLGTRDAAKRVATQLVDLVGTRYPVPV